MSRKKNFFIFTCKVFYHAALPRDTYQIIMTQNKGMHVPNVIRRTGNHAQELVVDWNRYYNTTKLLPLFHV